MRLKSSRRRLLMSAASLLTGWPLAGLARPKSLRIVTTNLPPLVIENSSEAPGALHELVTALCKRCELAPSIVFVPWQRALFLATHSAATTIFPLTRSAEREHLFRWLVPLYEENYVFLAPRGRAFDVRNPANMKEMRITLIRGSALKAVLHEMGYKNLVEAGSVEEVHRFMVAGIADAAYGELSIVRNSLHAHAAEADFEYSAPVSRTAAWLAGSLDFTEADSARFQHALKQMKADASYAAIFKRYQLG